MVLVMLIEFSGYGIAVGHSTKGSKHLSPGTVEVLGDNLYHEEATQVSQERNRGR